MPTLLITPERGRALQVLGVVARRKKKLQREAELLNLRAALEIALESAKPKDPPPPLDHVPARRKLESQLSRFDRMIDSESDPMKLDRLCAARSRLWESWRVLAGVPMPGSRRPVQERPARRATLPLPREPD